MLRFLLFFICLQGMAWGVCSQEEALFVRRILEFWKDRDIALVRSQILQFQHEYPQSDYNDSLRVILGDIFWQEKDYDKALRAYAAICTPACRAKVICNQLDCLYHLKNRAGLEAFLPKHTGSLTKEEAMALYFDAQLAFEKTLAEPSAALEKQARAHLLRLRNTPLNDQAQAALDQFALNKARSLYDKGSFDELMDHLMVEHPSASKSACAINFAKKLYEQNELEKAIAVLQHALPACAQGPHLVQMHLLLAACYQKEHPADFIVHAEKVLEMEPHFAERNTLHTHLFSAYWQQQKQQEAAEHLLVVMKENPTSVKTDNALWLANHYYNQVAEGQKQNSYVHRPLQDPKLLGIAQKGIFAFEYVLGVDPLVNSTTMALEQEIYKLSALYGWTAQPEAERDLLEKLAAQQAAYPTLPWKLIARTLYSLAESYRLSGYKLDALPLYKKLMSFPKSADAYITQNSKLQWALLAFNHLPADQKILENPAMGLILKTLKDLQIQKTAALEPLHLEAALAYVDFRSQLEPLDKQMEQKLFLYQRMQDDFTNSSDVTSKDYHAGHLASLEKHTLFQAYMLLLQVQINSLFQNMPLKQNLNNYKEK